MTAQGPSACEPQARRPRAREAGLGVGRLAVGAQNGITDVEGVRVGHATCWQPQDGVLTGVTAILPGPDSSEERDVAGGFALSSAGELCGLLQVMEWGLMENPMVLTNTVGVGVTAAATDQWLLEATARSHNPATCPCLSSGSATTPGSTTLSGAACAPNASFTPSMA